VVWLPVIRLGRSLRGWAGRLRRSRGSLLGIAAGVGIGQPEPTRPWSPTSGGTTHTASTAHSAASPPPTKTTTTRPITNSKPQPDSAKPGVLQLNDPGGLWVVVPRAIAVGLGLVGLVFAARVAGGVMPVQVRGVIGVIVVVLVPGWAMVGALGLDRAVGPGAAAAAAPVVGVAVWALPLAIGFGFGLPLWVVGGIVLVVTAASGAVRWPRAPTRADLGLMVACGALAAVVSARWQAPLIGDALFHSGVIRKLLVVPRLSLRGIWPFLGGAPHAGYAFPLLHGAQAASILVTGGDPSAAYTNMVPAFAALVAVVAYVVGSALAGRTAGVLTVVLVVYTTITGDLVLSVVQQPRYYVTFVALPVLWLAVVHTKEQPTKASAGLVLATVFVITATHSTYAPPAIVMLAAVSVFYPKLWRLTAAAALVAGATLGWIYAEALWGAPRYRQQTVPAGEFLTVAGHRVALSGEQLFNHRPEYVLALIAIGWFARQHRTRLGALAVMAAAAYLLAAVPGPIAALTTSLGAGQAQRYWEEIPWIYILAPAATLLARQQPKALPVIIIASVALAQADVLDGLAATSISLVAAIILLTLVIRALRNDRAAPPGPSIPPTWRRTLLWPAAFTVAVLAGSLSVHARMVATSLIHGKIQPTVSDQLTAGALGYFRTYDHELPVVLAPFQATPANWYSGISYELVGNASVYTVAVSSYHTESEPKDHPIQRRRDVARFLNTHTTNPIRNEILAAYHVNYVAINTKTSPAPLIAALNADPELKLVYTDSATSAQEACLEVWLVNPNADQGLWGARTHRLGGGRVFVQEAAE
jgi:hypothetical protein